MPPPRLRPTLLLGGAIALLLFSSTCWRLFTYTQRREAQRLVAVWDRQARRRSHAPPSPPPPPLPPPAATSPALCPAVRQRAHYAIAALFLSTADPDQHARYHESALKLGRSILHYSPDALLHADMILLLTPGAHPVDKFALHRAGWSLCLVDAIASPPAAQPNRFLEVGMFTRLQVWRLAEYAVVLSLDLDTLVVGDLAPLFTASAPQMRAAGQRLAAVPDSLSPGSMPFCGAHDHFNAGVLLLEPALATHDTLVAAMRTVDYDVAWAEQGLLNALFPPGSYLPLPFRYNARVAEAGCAPAAWRAALPDAAVLHFTVVKGWAMREWHPAWLGAVAWGAVHACFAWELIGREPHLVTAAPPPPPAARMTCKHVRPAPTTVVTALWDINREHHGDGRSFASYVQWLERTLQMNAPFVVFAPAKTLARVRRARDATGYPTCYVPLELRDTPYHRLFAADVEALLGSAAYRWRNHHPFRVEALNAEYDILQWSKIHLLNVAQNELNPFQSSSVMWVDAGLSRFTPPGLSAPFPHAGVVEKLLSRHPESTLFLSGGVYAYADQAAAEARCHDQMQWTGDNLLQGTLMLANGSSIAAFEAMWRQFLRRLLQNEQANNEQVLLAMLWCNDPGWFSVIDVPGAVETGHDFLRLDDFFWGRAHGTVTRFNGGATLVRRRQGVGISMVVPATAHDVPEGFGRLLASVRRQNVLPMELVLVVSGVTDGQCTSLRREVADGWRVHTKVLCFARLQHQSVSRNVGINASRGDWLAFVDADDEIFPQYFEVVQQHLAERPRLVLLLHGSTHQRRLHFDDRRLMDGHQLYQAHVASRAEHPWILPEITHGHAVVRTDMAKRVYFSTDPRDAVQEDCTFLREIMDLLGDDRDAMLYDNAPLTWYVRRQDKGTAARAWKRLVSAATRQPPPDTSSVDLHLAMTDYHDARRQQASLLRAAEPWISAGMV